MSRTRQACLHVCNVQRACHPPHWRLRPSSLGAQGVNKCLKPQTLNSVTVAWRGRRRPECEQGGDGRAHKAHPDRPRGQVRAGALAAAEQGAPQADLPQGFTSTGGLGTSIRGLAPAMGPCKIGDMLGHPRISLDPPHPHPGHTAAAGLGQSSHRLRSRGEQREDSRARDHQVSTGALAFAGSGALPRLGLRSPHTVALQMSAHAAMMAPAWLGKQKLSQKMGQRTLLLALCSACRGTAGSPFQLASAVRRRLPHGSQDITCACAPRRLRWRAQGL